MLEVMNKKVENGAALMIPIPETAGRLYLIQVVVLL